MPSVSEDQRRLFAMALSMKRRGMRKGRSSSARRIAETLSAGKIKEFAREVKK